MIAVTSRARALLAWCLLLALCASCASPQGSGAGASPEAAGEDVLRAHRDLLAALGAQDFDTISGLLTPEPELLIFHPRIHNRFDGVDAARDGLRQMFARLGEAAWWETHAMVTVEGKVAWLTSHLVVESPALTEPFLGRGTEVWIHRDGGWKLAHAHWSPLP